MCSELKASPDLDSHPPGPTCSLVHSVNTDTFKTRGELKLYMFTIYILLSC